MLRINSLQDLLDVRDHLGVAGDWHEPDEVGVSAKVTGRTFDNAGFWGSDERIDPKCSEIYVTLYQGSDPVAEVNLATLFAWATGYKG